MVFLYILIPIVILLLISVKILREYERAVVFTLGRFTSVKGPGLVLIIPFIQQVVKMDLRTIVMSVPPQDVISRDNVSVRVNAVVYFRVINADQAVIQVENYMEAISQLSQTTLRSVLGQHELDEMLAERNKLNENIQKILDEQTETWGIKVAMVEIKDLDLNETMVRAIAKQAEAERERRAKIIQEPQALQLRYLQTLSNIAEEKNSTIVFPIPIELLSAFKQFKQAVTKD
jgi:regulator of protease activity HflC (stomatin/prohibitin superfamily)